MTYRFNIVDGEKVSIQAEGLSIPLDPANRHYQEVLDAIIAEGADCFDGDIPAELHTAADAKLASGAYNANRA